MKVFFLLLVGFLGSIGVTGAEVTKLSALDREALKRARAVEMLFSTKSLPREVVSACATATSDHEFWLADPGKRFQLTDVDEGWMLPRRRLIWIARFSDYFVVHYEAGGRAHSYHILVIRADHNHHKARVVWSAAAIPLESYNDFLRALRGNKLDDTLPYFH